MKKEYVKAAMNPVRQRILQTIVRKKSCTTAQIGEALEDIPRASLYRHMKCLLDAGVIEVLGEEVKRGQVEKTYALKNPHYEENDSADMDMLVSSVLMQLNMEFANYFKKPDADPVKDMLSVGSAVVYLDDKECMEFFREYEKLLGHLMEKQPSENRKARRITLISSPCEEK